MMTDREKFEAWFRSAYEHLDSSIHAEIIDNIKSVLWMSWQAALASQQPADDDWIAWAGGDCPVSVNSLVNVRYRNGGGDLDSRPAKVYNWSHNDKDCYPIIAYRVVKP